MTTLSENIKNRVDKLPKPSNYAQGLQPLFEAISNAKFAIYDRFNDAAVSRGLITIDIKNIKSRKDVKIRVHDNGIGMDAVRFDAFCVVDTDYKKSRGGKGVGRLFWFDSFKNIHVESRFGKEDDQLRAFDFILREKEQISEHKTPDVKFQGVGTSVYFEGILDNEYASNFPKGSDAFLRYFTSHFISDFLMGVSPKSLTRN